MTPEQIKDELRNFTGTEHYYKHPFGNLFTQGVKFLIDECQCWWLIDACISWQFDKKVSEQEFIAFKLKVNAEKSAVLYIEDGNYNVIATQEIEFTDFPLDEIIIWLSNGVFYLPSEH
jgi:hypothetical protein